MFYPFGSRLTYLSLVPHTYICASESGQYWFRLWFGAYLVPRHYQSQCWVIVSWTLRNKMQWNLKYKTFHSRKCIWKYRRRNGVYFVQGGLKMSSAKWRRLFCLGLNAITNWDRVWRIYASVKNPVLVKIKTRRLYGDTPLSKPMLTYR